MKTIWRNLLPITLVLALAAGPAQAQNQVQNQVQDQVQDQTRHQADDAPLGDSEYQPEVGQAGKDVIWIPTPNVLVHAMLATAQVSADDFVVDLGSGDGKIAISAARDFGAQALGIEYNPQMVALARRNATRAGVADKVQFEQADIFTSDFSTASVVTLYLLPDLNLKLRPTLLNMRPGTRIVSNSYTMGDWEPDKIINTVSATGYFWVVPANIAGRWTFTIGDSRFTAAIRQQYQQIDLNGGPLRSGELRGDQIELALADGRTLNGTIDGDRMGGAGWQAARQSSAD